MEMITEFFTEHLEQLKAYGAILDNPMEILFKGLLAVPCEEFHHYINDKKNRYYDESLTCTPKGTCTHGSAKVHAHEDQGGNTHDPIT